MRIGINASFLRKQNTGIGQVSINFLKKLIEVESEKSKVHKAQENEFVLYLEEDIKLELPDNFQKSVFLPVYKRDDLIRKIWWEKNLLPKKALHDKCDVLLSLYQSATILGSRKDIKHIMLVHDIIPNLFPSYLNNARKKMYQKLTEKAIKKADKIVSVSHRTEKDLIQELGIDPAKITVSYIDVDPLYKKEIEATENRDVLIKYNLKKGYIYNGGGLEVRKNVENVIRAYKILLESHPEAIYFPKLVISGKMMPQLAPLVTDVEKLVKDLKLEHDVRLLDYVPQEDLPVLYANASMFVYPSYYEGFGLPVLEAMNQATPVITGKNSSLPEVGSDAVLYANPSDVEELARVMKKVLTNENLRSTLSTKGKERAKHFSWDKFTQKMLNIVLEMR
jgi:glycosyltransferase involved in cell wall biosynthesis